MADAHNNSSESSMPLVSNFFGGTHGSIQEFCPESGSWKNYARKLKFYLAANNVLADEQKKAILLTVIGDDVVTTLCSILTPREPEDFSFNELLEKLEHHYAPAVNDTLECFHFYSRVQKDTESVSDFATAIRKLAKTCDFQDLDKQLRVRLVCGIRDEHLQQRLLTEKNLSFERALDIAKSFELAKKSSRDIRSASLGNSSKSSVFQVQEVDNSIHFSDSRKQPQWKASKPSKTHPQPVQQTCESKSKSCYRCGEAHASFACPHISAICRYCKKKGHILKVCKARLRNATVSKQSDQTHEAVVEQPSSQHHCVTQSCNTSDSVELVELFTMENPKTTSPYFVQLLLNEKPCSFEVDSGASFSIISLQTFNHLWPSDPPALQASDLSLKLWNQQQMKVLGVCDVRVTFESRTATLPLFVSNLGGRSLLGRNWFEPLGISLTGLNSFASAASWVSLFPGLFDGHKGPVNCPPVHLELKNDAQPVFLRPRPIAFALREKVDAALDALVRDGILEQTQYSAWATPIVPVLKKDQSIRICMDYRSTVNPNVRTNVYPLPIISQILTTLSGATHFSQLDMSQAYLQLPVDDASSEILTINTHKGLFKVKRLPFGLTSSPAIFQRFMETLLAGLQGVAVYLDDVIISGKSKVEHDERLREVLGRMDNAHVLLNKDKCIFNVQALTFLGFHIDADGIHPTTERVKAIHDAPVPTCKTELQAFLGLINFYNAFLKDKASVAEPLHRLLRKDTPWNFGKVEKEAFLKLKSLLQSSDVLVHFDPGKTLVLTCDASAVGVGAVLSHEDASGSLRPVAFASRTLNKAERNYSQTDREALAIIFGVKKFNLYLLGRPFKILTDHRPLLGLLGANKKIPQVIAPRLLRWNLMLAGYDYELHYVPGRKIQNADALSRLPISTSTDSSTYFPDPADVLMLETDNLPIQVEEIQVATQEDPILSKVVEHLETGISLDELQDPAFAPFARKFTELSLQKNCLLWGTRVVIPTRIRDRVLRELHACHPGIASMKSLARGYVWWPGIDEDIAITVQTCQACQSTRNLPAQEKPSRWEAPADPWSRIHVDLASLSAQRTLLLVVDATSKWVEASILQRTTSEAIMTALRRIFASQGIPNTIVTDNGRCFTSAQFQEFLAKNGIHHIRTAPYHPSSNGQVERYVQSVKNALRRMSGSNLQDQLSRYLFHQHITPNATTHKSPAELLLGRPLRSRLLKMVPAAQVRSHHSPEPKRSFAVNDPVFVHQPLSAEKWSSGRIVRQLGSRMYEVVLPNNEIRRCHLDQLRIRSIPPQA